MNEYNRLIADYIELFDEGPPVFGMQEDEAIAVMKRAIADATPIEQGAEQHIPDGALL